MEFNKELFFKAIEQIAEQNFLSKEEVKEIIKESVYKTFKSKLDPDADLEMSINDETEEFKLINKNKLIVGDDEFEEEYKGIQVPLSEAIKINPNAKVDDVISEEVDFASFDKKISNQIRQLITQQVREKRKLAVFAKHKSLKGEMIEATVTSSTKSYVNFVLDDGTTAFMPPNLRNLTIPLNIGEKVKVFVEDVLEESKDSQIIVSNGSPTIVRRILEAEVPEISEGIVEIVRISRIAGFRSKVAIRTLNSDIDALGAVIGAQGSRINTIVDRLQGEKLDIILWSPDINEFVVNTLSPAKVISIFDKKNESGEVVEGHKVVITPNRHQTLAIGKKGTNVKLTVELTDTRVDVISIDKAKEDGIEFEWNGNVTPETLESIEQGIRQTKTFGKPSNNNNVRIDSKDIDIDLTSFAESMEVDEIIEEKETVNIDDSMFSETELKQMEANFEFDNELADFDFDEENFDFEESNEE